VSGAGDTRWPDARLDERFRAIDQVTELMRDTMEALQDMPAAMVRTVGETESRLQAQIQSVDRTCAEFRKEYRRDKEARERAEAERRTADRDAQQLRASERARNTITLVVGMLGLLGAVLGALIATGTI
jgi:biopolymer transport protein ExbB/TolQ